MRLMALAIIAILGTPSSTLAQDLPSFALCEGEYQSRCPANTEAYTYCYTVKDWAERVCKQSELSGNYTAVQLYSKGGNKCGYSVWKITCKR